MRAIARLSATDVTNLSLEAPDTPMQQAVLATLDAAPLRGADGRIDLDALRAHIAARLDRTPELRRTVFRPGLGLGRPLLVDDPDFRIEEHLRLEVLPAPGGESAALAFAAREMALRFDRSKPLWAMWILEGYSPDRVGMLIKLHHAIADGGAMVNMLVQILDLEPRPFERPTARWTATPRPRARELFADSVATKAQAVLGALRAVRHPLRGARAFIAMLRATVEEVRQAGGAARTSINQPIGAGRAAGAMHVSLPEAKSVAHVLGVKLNDIFLFVVTRSLRRVLVNRGEAIPAAPIHVSVAVSRPAVRAAVAAGNHSGTVLVPVPLDSASAGEQLAAIAAATAQAKAGQQPVLSLDLMTVMARLGLARALMRHQHMLNVLTTNLPGPPVALYLAGTRVYSPVALPPIAGNVAVSFAALSYESELTLSAIADAHAWPDFAELQAGMFAAWVELKTIAARARPQAAAAV